MFPGIFTVLDELEVLSLVEKNAFGSFKALEIFKF
jgi:hypothetical protein